MAKIAELRALAVAGILPAAYGQLASPPAGCGDDPRTWDSPSLLAKVTDIRTFLAAWESETEARAAKIATLTARLAASDRELAASEIALLEHKEPM